MRSKREHAEYEDVWSSIRDDEKAELHRLASAAPRELREAFEVAYTRWLKACKQPEVSFSSLASSRAEVIEFQDLLALGADALPLFMEKMVESQNFFLLQAIDRLIRKDLVVDVGGDVEAIRAGEQYRAVMTLRRWLHSAA